MESDANIYKNQIKGFAEVTGNFHPINYYKSAQSPRRNSAMVIQKTIFDWVQCLKVIASSLNFGSILLT